MKRCPECRRDYYDDTLFYCLDDGSRLLDGPASNGGEKTLFLSEDRISGEAPTAIHRTSDPRSQPWANSVAVLPFSNVGGDASNEYFSDGLSEELLNALAKINGLRVAARTSAFSFKGRQATVAEIGTALNVSYILGGSVRSAGNRMRISVNLESVSDGYQIWSETYDRNFDDIFAVQDDIARTVVEELRNRLTGEPVNTTDGARINLEVAEAFKGRSADPEAQRLMLLGRHYLDLTTHENSAKAVECFRNALEIDPQFALCWAELGRAFAVQAGSSWVPQAEGFKLAKEAVERALSLEPELAEAHALRGRILAANDRDLVAAEAAYGRALELAPGSSSVLDGACIMAYRMGRIEEAMDLSRRVLEKDPLSSAFWHNLGLICHVAGRHDEAENAFRRALEIAPHRSATNSMLALVLFDQGRSEESLARAELEPDEFWRLWGTAIVNWNLGRSGKSNEFLNQIIASHAAGNEFQIAEIYGARQEVDQAFIWLDRAIAEKDPGVTHAKATPRLMCLRGDPRWPEMLERIGF